MTFLTTAEGGRSNPVLSGYRPQFYYQGRDWDAAHEYIGTERVLPGATVQAYLTFLSPEHHVGKLHVGQDFLIREGSRTIAKGHVIRILELAGSTLRVADLPGMWQAIIQADSVRPGSNGTTVEVIAAVTDGAVVVGANLEIELNRGFIVTVPIVQIVELGDHQVKLILDGEDTVGANLIEALNFEGELLVVSQPMTR